MQTYLPWRFIAAGLNAVPNKWPWLNFLLREVSMSSKSALLNPWQLDLVLPKCTPEKRFGEFLRFLVLCREDDSAPSAKHCAEVRRLIPTD
jgi:hypothetical protein